MKKTDVKVRILAGLMVAFMLFSVVAGVLAYLLG